MLDVGNGKLEAAFRLRTTSDNRVERFDGMSIE